jgi:V8-like Glu-specific endopeptidase
MAGHPDEGMWLPMFIDRLNYVDMQKEGLRLTADELYSINHSSLKDAIVSLGGFCTAEVVSKEGLLLTNHHCGFESIQKHSSIDHDYLTDGFWAMNRSEELPNEGLYASFLVRMDDVTKKVLANVKPQMTETERSAEVRKVITDLKAEASEKGKYTVDVKGFYNGNEYYMFVYQVYEDIRLVGAPPSAIGKFGGDTDNWMWPRHTGDFSMFRIYAKPDGSPSKYSKDNVPLNAKYHLPISIKGVQKDDFTMIWGYPGSTDRYMTSFGVNETINDINPAIIKLLGNSLDIMKEVMDTDPKVKIQYASNYAMLANFWKNKIGETRGLKRLNVYDKKKNIEEQFQNWINADTARKAKYGIVLPEFEKISKLKAELQQGKLDWYLNLTLYASSTLKIAMKNMSIENTVKSKMEKAKKDEAIKQLEAGLTETFKDYNPVIEERMLASLLASFCKDIPETSQPELLKKINSKYKGDFKAYAKEYFENSMFASEDNFRKFLKKPTEKKLKKDMGLELVKAFMGLAMQGQMSGSALKAAENKANRLFIAGLREMNPDKKFYPNANSTMRVTYGQVLDYYPADAIHYDYVTTLDGVMEKEDPKNEEFIVPAKLKDLYLKKDFGPYADKSGKLVTCFLSNNDITGGNSGSPIINGNGELLGLAFDGNWEAMSGDVAFEPELQRTINVDIRYVLFIIDKYAGAGYLVKEMTIR